MFVRDLKNILTYRGSPGFQAFPNYYFSLFSLPVLEGSGAFLLDDSFYQYTLCRYFSSSFLMFVCLIPFGALRLEALSYVYWEKPSLDTMKVVGASFTGV